MAARAGLKRRGPTAPFHGMLNDPALAGEPPDRFWARVLLGMVEAWKDKRPPGISGAGASDPSVVFRDGIARLQGMLSCVNCGGAVTSASSAIYCCELCQQMAGTVRYVRKAEDNRRVGDDEFLVGLGQRLVALLKGGYPARARFLDRSRREAVFERDGRTCQLCGKPAEQIDHIGSNSSEFSNLRAVCAPCNQMLAMTAASEPSHREVTRMLEQAEEVCSDLAVRMGAAVPGRCCDDHERWQPAEPGLRKARRRLLKEMDEVAETDFEDVDGYLWHSMQKDG